MVPCAVIHMRTGSIRRVGQRSSHARRSRILWTCEGGLMDELEAATVIEGDAAATVADAAKKSKARGAPKWETEARDRLKAAIRKFSKPLGAWCLLGLAPIRL